MEIQPHGSPAAFSAAPANPNSPLDAAAPAGPTPAIYAAVYSATFATAGSVFDASTANPVPIRPM